MQEGAAPDRCLRIRGKPKAANFWPPRGSGRRRRQGAHRRLVGPLRHSPLLTRGSSGPGRSTTPWSSAVEGDVGSAHRTAQRTGCDVDRVNACQWLGLPAYVGVFLAAAGLGLIVERRLPRRATQVPRTRDWQNPSHTSTVSTADRTGSGGGWPGAQHPVGSPIGDGRDGACSRDRRASHGASRRDRSSVIERPATRASR